MAHPDRPWPAPERWPPFTRVLLAGGGAALVFYGARRDDRVGFMAMIAGALLALVGLSGRGRVLARPATGDDEGIDIERSIVIAAPPERLFALWSDGSSFPLFLSHVKEVRPLGDDRWHWIVEGPAGLQLEWISQLTDRVQPHLLAWRSLPEAEIEQVGHVRFEPLAAGTRVTLRLRYRPRSDLLGPVAATLAGRRPLRQMFGDLQRLKRLVESGGPPQHDAPDAGAGLRLPGIGTSSFLTRPH